jgi:hypothetical protein
LQAGGKIIKDRAVQNVHKLTGALAADIVIVTRMREEGLEKYVLIGPGWSPDAYRRVANRQVGNRTVASADSSTNPGIYGYFLEVGHRAPGKGLAHNPQFKRDQAAARKQSKKVDTSKYGQLATPPYPWLGPAVESETDAAIQAAADVIETRLAEQGL